MASGNYGKAAMWRAVGRGVNGGLVWLGLGLIWVYRYTLSPLIGFHCRFHPTCSVYAREALVRHGAWRGGWLAVRRLGRCHPWGGSGVDEVP